MSGKVGSITTGIITDGLVFNMDAANRASYPKTGTTATDTITPTHSGSFNNDVTFNSSPPNFEFGLDGVDDYIEFNDDSSFYNTPVLTISFWYYTDASAQVGQVVSRRSGDFEVYRHTTANSFYTYFGGAAGNNAKIAVATHAWYNVTFVLEGTTQYSYRNGELIVSAAMIGTPSFSHSYPLSIGRRSEANQQYFDGSIACMHLYDRPLSANEVLHNYNALRGRFGV